ncbi:transposase [Microbacterium maritypicum]|uniref:transposase n=1 Tax=Microbacterium maritypicum TaxID=33918 RepID=UPI001B339A49|nr:transposase [Microbacterium liquefaciens]MBP5800786.1 transposase [Microbacterium liquefaciens]
MAEPTFEEIAAGLYSGPPEEFVSSRKARAEEAGEAALASRILALRKPSIAAWVVNVFAQERAGQLAEALALARELREAQDDLDAAALAKLGRERRLLTRKLAQAAGELAASRGERVTPSTLEAVEQSISAAFFDTVAASAVASGRLVRALAPSATATDVRDAVAGELPELESLSAPAVDELRDRRARRDAERAIAAAEKEQASAERELADRDAALRELRARKGELTARVSELEDQLARARADLNRAERDLPEAEQRRVDATMRADAAADALDVARKAKEAL